MKTYICLKRISKDGTLYQVGEEIQLTDEQAARLPVKLKKSEPKAEKLKAKE